jgi:hypothetical protein
MNDEDNVIDVEAVEIEETVNLPAVVEVSNRERIKPSGWVEKPPPSPRRDAELSEHPENQCAGHKKNGERCRKYAIRGATVCRTHGGATKHVRNRARIRIENATDRLMGKLIEFAFDDTKPPDTQLRAIRDALDRGGLKPPSEVVLSQGEPKPYEQVFDGIYSGPPIQTPSVSRGYDSAGLGQGVEDAETACAPTQPHPEDQTRSTDQAEPREYGHYSASSSWSEGSESFGDEPPRRPRPRESERERRPEPRERHITGDNALRFANRANEMNRDMPPPLAIESRHKRYRRP